MGRRGPRLRNLEGNCFITEWLLKFLNSGTVRDRQRLRTVFDKPYWSTAKFLYSGYERQENKQANDNKINEQGGLGFLCVRWRKSKREKMSKKERGRERERERKKQNVKRGRTYLV